MTLNFSGSTVSTRFDPFIGWGCYQMGFGRKPDPEPGRCRRTDGKEWRCSGEAHPDSKYCEKHMHRRRNRVKKTLDQNQTTAPLTSPSLSFPQQRQPNEAYSTRNRFGVGSSNCRGYFKNHSLDYPYRPSSSPKKCFQGAGERTFFPEASRSFQDTDHHHTYSSSSSSSQHQDHHHHQQQQHLVLGADMFNKPTRTAFKNTLRQGDQNQEEEDRDSSETKKSLHHFFGEDWEQNKSSSESWLDLSSQSRLDTGS
ncbi:hypothetical protein Bca52824_018813 [Brassica carinata]|uniref:Growth-regulating factor n=1 Tax=Brassica carinata TaxID=52824 RepID=A0A8X7VQE4_BRACI|nr:hypothetical protein Bca52824_018813 [Brassica carinata]